MALKESDVNFFRPLWIRLLVTAVCVVWFVLEALFTRDPLWLGISGVGIVYCAWNFFLRWPGDKPAGPPSEPPASPPTQP
jgi:hypothetical protein